MGWCGRNEIEEVGTFKYLVMISADGDMGEEVAQRSLEGGKVWEMMGKLSEEN